MNRNTVDYLEVDCSVKIRIYLSYELLNLSIKVSD